MKNIFLIGFMGCGKSTVASCMEKLWGMQRVEMDELIAECEGMSIPEIFEKKGELYFRDKETEILVNLQEVDNRIVSCGGGVVLREENVATMKKNGVVVLLTAIPETILERVKHDENRPLLKGNKNVEYIRKMLDQRRLRYAEAADITISTDDKTAYHICEEIVKEM